LWFVSSSILGYMQHLHSCIGLWSWYLCNTFLVKNPQFKCFKNWRLEVSLICKFWFVLGLCWRWNNKCCSWWANVITCPYGYKVGGGGLWCSWRWQQPSVNKLCQLGYWCWYERYFIYICEEWHCKNSYTIVEIVSSGLLNIFYHA
jgi:hypothetical protein